MLRISHHSKVWAGVLGRGKSWCKGPGVGLILVSHKLLKRTQTQSCLLPRSRGPDRVGALPIGSPWPPGSGPPPGRG